MFTPYCLRGQRPPISILNYFSLPVNGNERQHQEAVWKVLVNFTCNAIPINYNAHHTDSELLQLIRQGDEPALKSLYYRYYAELCQKAYRRIQNEAIVEEIVQDVFFNLWVKAADLETTGSVSGWLYAVLRNKVLHAMREENRRSRHHLQSQQESHHAINDVIAITESKEVEAKIRSVIAKLPEQCQKAFVLSRYQHLSYPEIAAQMGISVKTVEKHVSKALQVLRSELREMDVLLLCGLSLGALMIVA